MKDILFDIHDTFSLQLLGLGNESTNVMRIRELQWVIALHEHRVLWADLSPEFSIFHIMHLKERENSHWIQEQEGTKEIRWCK